MRSFEFDRERAENTLIGLRIQLASRPDDRAIQRRIELAESIKQDALRKLRDGRAHEGRLVAELDRLLQVFDDNTGTLDRSGRPRPNSIF